MRKVKYSPDAKERLKQIKDELTAKFDKEIAKKVVLKMMKSIRELENFGDKGPSIEKLSGIPTDYRYLYVQHNYVFYRIDGNNVWVTDIYNEKEDFMWKLFGIKTIEKGTDDYWNE